MRAFSSFLALLALPGCVASPAADAPPVPVAEAVSLPRRAANSSGDTMQALGHGQLIREDGCLRLMTPGGSRLIVWPSAAVLTDDGASVRDRSTGHGVRIGDTIVIGGGEVDRIDPGTLAARIPPQCQGPYWVAGSGFHKAPEEGWRTVRTSGPYSVQLPAEMLQVPMTPIDSIVDVYRSPTLTLTFDYGAFACGIRGAEIPADLRTSTTYVDQRPVEIDRWSEPSDQDRRIERLEARMRGVDLPRRTAPGGSRYACLTVHAQCETARDCDIARGIVSTLWIGPTSRDEAIGRVLSENPELEAYRTRSLPPHSILAEGSAAEGWRIAFIRSGSGIHSILDALCYEVSRFGEVRSIGSWRRAGRDVRRLDLRRCRPAG